METLVSVDLDDLACYRTIYGIPAAEDPEDVVLQHCLPRFLELFATTGTRATFFVIGRTVQRDLDRGGRGVAHLRRALAEGHELANHSDAHDYAMTQWSPAAISEDLRRCHARLEGLGATVTGFRAPGYTHDATLLDQVAAQGYRYDSSLLPSRSYYLLKQVARSWLAWTGRPSGSFPSPRAAFTGPRCPFITAQGLCEIPMSVGPLGTPLIGTTLLHTPQPFAEGLGILAARQPYLHVELHGIDLADPACDPIPTRLRDKLPELRVPAGLKLRRLQRLLTQRCARRTLAEFAATFAGASESPA